MQLYLNGSDYHVNGRKAVWGDRGVSTHYWRYEFTVNLFADWLQIGRSIVYVQP